MGQVGGKAVRAHVWVHRDRIGRVAVKGFGGVVLGSRPNVSSLCVEDEQVLRKRRPNGLADSFERRLPAECRKVRDLRLEGAAVRGCGGCNLEAEGLDGFKGGAALQWLWKLFGLGVEAHTEQALVFGPGGLTPIDELHSHEL